MNTYEALQKEQAEFINTQKRAFADYLGGGDFSPARLIEFCNNVLYIKHAKTQEQKLIKDFVKSFHDDLEKINKGQAEATFKAIFKNFPNPHIKSWGAYIDSVINFDDSMDYKSRIFERRFPTGTISYIGARPGRGKTTMLVNIALDAMNQGKPVILATSEETTKQLITRLILADTCARNVGNLKLVDTNFKPRTELYKYFKGASKVLEGFEIPNGDFFGKSIDYIKTKIESGALKIFEAYGASWEELTNFLSNQEAGSVILIDYIQHLKSPERLTTQTRQIQVQEISHTLADLAGLNGLILICGAQFNRPKDEKTDMKKADTFTENSFREAGDIEQDGHILLGIGKNPATEELFYSCMKDREATPDNGKCWRLKKNLAFSFLQGEKDENNNKVEYKAPQKEKREKRKDEQSKDEDMKNFRYGRSK